MRNDVDALMVASTDGLSTCDSCPFRTGCAYATSAYTPGYCVHEYKLLHAFLSRRVRERGPQDAGGYARLAEEAARYAEWLRRERPFDPRSVSNVAPSGPGMPVPMATPQSNLLAFGNDA